VVDGASPRCDPDKAREPYPSFVPNLIGGADRPAEGGGQIDIVNPHSGEAIGRLARSAVTDVDAAVHSAKTTQPAWAATPAVRRGEILHAVANALEAHRTNWQRS